MTAASEASARRAEGPFFDELEVGQVFDGAPGVTLTEGRAAVHQSILGDRLRLPLDGALAATVTGMPVAHPALVWNVAIGQSTLATQHVKANLFYRNLALLHQPVIGDTLRTATTVVGLRENTRREGRAPTGLAALRMTTRDQYDRPVLDFYRCAMLPLMGERPTGHHDDLDTIAGACRPDDVSLERSVGHWNLDAWRREFGARPPAPGEVVEVVGGDVVTGGPELARLSLNIAAVHHDHRAGGGRRLVYGGHTIGLALGQVARAFPDLLTVLAWEGCDHLGPVHEGDTLRSAVTVGPVRPGAGGHLVDLRSEVTADDARPVLDWRFTALFG